MQKIFVCVLVAVLFVMPGQLKSANAANKQEIVVEMAKKAGISKAEALRAFNAFVDLVANELNKGSGRVAIVEFGTFSVHHTSARQGRNPQTGKVMHIPARKFVRFKSDQTFEKRIK